MPTATVLDLLTASLVKIRVHRMAAPLPPEMAQDALDELNRLLEAWQVDGRMVYRWVELVTPLTGAASYTIGPGGDVNTTRPLALHDGFTRIGGTDYPYTVLPVEVYLSLRDKSAPGFAPVYVMYDAAFPLGVIVPWPPTSGGALHLFMDQPAESAVLNDLLSLPLGYANALIYALGRRLASTYGQTLDPGFLEEARKAETGLRRRAHRPQYATIRMPGDHGMTDSDWINTGGF